jgi:tripartite-type tricarboxylate transporter receptor subunit TctC
MRACLRFAHRLALAVACVPLGVIADAAALDYPTKPVRIIVGFAPGGGTDIMARLLAQRLSERLGQSFIVENRPGAGGNIAAETVVRAAADGHTLLLVASPNAINATLYGKLNFNIVTDVSPVAAIMRVPHVILVNPSFPAKTVPEFIAYAKAHVGEVSMASAGVGSTNHVSGELFNMMASVKMVHVPYRGGGPALGDLVAGHVQVMFGNMASSIEYFKSGTLRALAVTSAKRLDALPNIPTVDETLPGYETTFWGGLAAPKNTPIDIVDKLNKEVNVALAEPQMKTQLADLGGTVLAGSPADFEKLIVRETQKWSKVVKFADIKAE